MTAGLGSRPIAGKNFNVAPEAVAVLLGTALVAAALIGAAMTGSLGAVGSNKPAAEAAAASTLSSQALIEFRASERASWAGAAGTSASAVSQAFLDYRAAERASEGALAETSAAEVSQALIDFRAGERASEFPSDVAASSLAAQAFSEYRVSQRTSGAGKAQDDIAIAMGLSPVTSQHAPGHGPLE